DPGGAGWIDLEWSTGPGPVRPDVQHRRPGLRGDRPAAVGRGTEPVADGSDQRQGSEAAGHPLLEAHGRPSADMAAPHRPAAGFPAVPELPGPVTLAIGC